MKTPSFLKKLCSANLRFHGHFMGLNAPWGQNIHTGFWVNVNTKHQKMRWNGFEYGFQLYCTHLNFRHISGYLTYNGLAALLKQSNLRRISFTSHHNVSLLLPKRKKKTQKTKTPSYALQPLFKKKVVFTPI